MAQNITTRSYSIPHNYVTHLVRFLITAVIGCVLVYASSVYAVVSHTVALERVDDSTASLQASLYTLESQYISLSHKVTPRMMGEFGLREEKVALYIDRTPTLSTTLRSTVSGL